MPLHRPQFYLCTFLAAGLSSLVGSSAAMADVWVFEPTAAIDQRIDDNYTINQNIPDKISATRVIGTVGLSREAPSVKFLGLLRADALLTQTDAKGSELDSNRIGYLSAQFTNERSEYGINLNYKFDTPSRDIGADITDISSVAADTGASVTQDSNVARERWVVSPNWRYNLTRRTAIETELTHTQVTHKLPTLEDALRSRWQQLLAANSENTPSDFDSFATSFDNFTIQDELDDFKESTVDVGIKTKLSPISTLSFFVGYSDYSAKVEADERVKFVDDGGLIRIPDPASTTIPPENSGVTRTPKRQRLSNTTKFRIGYDRAFTPTLNVGIQVGIFTSETDDSDLMRVSDQALTEFANDPVLFQEALDGLKTKNSGYLANVTATKSTGVTRYSARFGVDVLPSDIGSQVESLEVVGDLFRQIGPLLDFSFRARAYEPDALNASSEDKFSRRFISLEPKLIWRFSRAWTVAGSYRYRRQKSRADINSGESNALLFSLKYTPPSAIRDAVLNK